MEEKQAAQGANGSFGTPLNSSSIPSCENGTKESAPDNSSTQPSTDLPLVFPAADVKYFVGGFQSDVTEKDLRVHFSSFGSVADVKIMRDAASGRSRGFGFVTMAEPSSKQRIMAEKQHIIGGRKASVRPYTEQSDYKDSFTDGPILKRKVFVGGVNPALGHEALENYFGKYGPLEDATIMRYPDGRSRGFGFVVFRDEHVCQQVLQQRNHCITPRDKVEVKPCLSRVKARLPGPASGMMGGLDMHYGHCYNVGRLPYGVGSPVNSYGAGSVPYGGAGAYCYRNPGGYGAYGSNVTPVNAAASWAPYDTYSAYYGGWAGGGGAYSGGSLGNGDPSALPRLGGSDSFYDLSPGVPGTAPNTLAGGGHPGYALPMRRGPGGEGIPPPGLAPPYGQGMNRGRIAPY